MAKVVDKNTLKFVFTDSANNTGTGTIKRGDEGVILSIKPARVADPKCVAFYKENIELKPARLSRPMWEGPLRPDRANSRLPVKHPEPSFGDQVFSVSTTFLP